jgi:hypothetical protein
LGGWGGAGALVYAPRPHLSARYYAVSVTLTKAVGK